MSWLLRSWGLRWDSTWGVFSWDKNPNAPWGWRKSLISFVSLNCQQFCGARTYVTLTYFLKPCSFLFFFSTTPNDSHQKTARKTPLEWWTPGLGGHMEVKGDKWEVPTFSHISNSHATRATWRECGCLVLSSDCSTKAFATPEQLLGVRVEFFDFLGFVLAETHEKPSVQRLWAAQTELVKQALVVSVKKLTF